MLAYVSGANQLDERKLAAAAGGRDVPRVDADTVRTVTGYPIGGVPPFGHATDAAACSSTPTCSRLRRGVGGGRHVARRVRASRPADLVRASGGTVVDLKR